MIAELKQYYSDKGISPVDFRCPHLEDCRRDCETFTKAKEALVGSEYEKHTLPRILFVSLDSGWGDPDPRNRTLEAQRQHFEAEDYNEYGRKNEHWYRTIELASIILKQFKQDLTVESVRPYFAHTNSAKCSMNKPNMAQADRRLFDNCRGYIPEEIRLLNPDILITQGIAALNVVVSGWATQDESIHIIDKNRSFRSPDCEHRIIKMNDKDVFWFPTDHPRSFGYFNAQRRDCFERWAKMIYEHFSLHGWGNEEE